MKTKTCGTCCKVLELVEAKRKSEDELIKLVQTHLNHMVDRCEQLQKILNHVLTLRRLQPLYE